MAKQVGKVLFLGTRLGCTGYVLGGKPYIRRRSTLDGKRVRQDAAFARSRVAAAAFGEAARFTARLWREVPAELKRLMDGGAYNRIVNAVREGHASNGAWQKADDLGNDGLGLGLLDRTAVRCQYGATGHAVRPYSLEGLGGVLNGLDLSAGHLLAEGVALVARDRKGVRYRGAGDLLHLRGCGRVGFEDLDGLLPFCGDAEAVRARVVTASVGLRSAPSLKGVGCSAVGEWVLVEPGCGAVMVDLPAACTGGALRIVGLEVAVKRRGRWKRLVAGCKVYVLEVGGIRQGCVNGNVRPRRGQTKPKPPLRYISATDLGSCRALHTFTMDG